ncbi:hypothetical protein BT63DRAFT_446947 [Microthyrium microscopicum]|uniref:Probable beta-glucosidase E n=1 Tax=Microthyrium microscopicum TaxID=703497 RepID=A0A6A6UDF4_9PEZI|nr:hypothetical protein BT63DRAFT_446947 [Microthyrium microscopicum]
MGRLRSSILIDASDGFDCSMALRLMGAYPAWWPRWLRLSKFVCYLFALFVGCVVLLIGLNLFFFWRAPPDGQSPAFYPSPKGGSAREWADSYAKAAKMVRQMTLPEKVNVTTGIGWMMGMCVGNTGPVERLGFPSLCLQDGPLGIRFADNITAFPAGITVGATWNRELMYERGKAHGLEAKLKGVNVLLGPCMGPVGRSPLGGRNWEGFGSDPVLQGIASAETIKGIQSQGVIATAKHWVGNEQEHFRQSNEWLTPNAISSNIDDRTLHELYAWPFQDSVKAGVGSVMCSYNQVNNSYACQNSKLMNGVLKDEFGFQGFIQSDWLAQRSGVSSTLAGLDVTMPGDGLWWADGKTLWGPSLTTSILNGSVPMDRLDDMATRVVAAWYQMGQDTDPKLKDGPNFSSWTNQTIGLIHAGSDDQTKGVVNKFVNVQGEGVTFHSTVARNVAIEGIVLLKNTDNFLPLNRNGTSQASTTNTTASGINVGIFGSDAFPDPNGPNSCTDRACMDWTIGSGWGSGAVEFPFLVSPYEALQRFFNNHSTVELSTFKSNKLTVADLKDTAEQQLCLVFVMADGGEGYLAVGDVKADRNDLFVQKDGVALLENVTDKCGGDVVVVIHAVGPVSIESFIDKPKVKAVLLANLPGEESGNALADILGGTENPSGRLPYTMGKSLDDYGPAANIIRMVTPKQPIPQQDFTEGLLIDYRHFDHYNITPRYEFGYGLSYTTFALSNLTIHNYKLKSALPDPRPNSTANPPTYDTKIPSIDSAIFPLTIRQLKKYIYPYITASDARKIKHITVRQPPATPLSPAGGAPGGNPSLYDIFVNVTATVTNTGTRDGKAVVQLYISLPTNFTDPETHETPMFPVRVLRNFTKVALKKGENTTVDMALTRRDLSYWSAVRGNWVMPTVGDIGIAVGFSSRDLPLKGVY